jgi:propanol-preferring alcohol dehydrogenase
VRVEACAVCRTDLHVVDGELADPKLPLMPGHPGDRAGRENICDRARFTGYQVDGGYAERTVADERFCFAVPPGYAALPAAPLLCGGLIGYRALRKADDVFALGAVLGLYGFGAAAHVVLQVARHQGWRVAAFTRADDRPSKEFARSLGAEWRVIRSVRRHSRSTRRSSSSRPASWCRRRCERPQRAQ